MARYIDTGTRDPSKTVAHWLSNQAVTDLVDLRLQTGYFGATGLGPFQAILSHLKNSSFPVSAVIGANNGETTKADMDFLFSELGMPRPNARLAVASYDGGLFHPKVIQLERIDGSKAAYVGSANLTQQGIGGGNVEAGVIFDTAEGDEAKVLDDIAACIDDCFTGTRPGMSLISSSSDIQALLAAGILTVSPPPRPPASNPAGSAGMVVRPRLRPLVALPRLGPGPQPTTGSGVTPTTSAVTAVTIGFGFDPILVAEIGGGPRWKQANFPIALIQNYFGVTVGANDSINLSHVDDSKAVSPPENIPFVAVKSQNYRFELKSVSGIPYPTSGRPIGVFLRTAPKSFDYHVFLPTEPGHVDLDALLVKNYIGPANHLKRVVKSVSDLRAAWPLCPLI